MQNLGSDNSSGKLTGTGWAVEKIFRFGIPAALIWGGIKLFNFIAPDITLFLTNVWWIIGLGVPLAMLALYVISNPSFIWMQYKNLCSYLTSWLIKMDPLSFMDRYIDILIAKLSALQETKTNLVGQKVELGRQMKTLKENIELNMRKAKANYDVDRDEANHLASLAAGDKESYDLYEPIFNRIVKNIDFLDKLAVNWQRSIEKLKHEVDRKRTEYKTLATAAKALGQAEEFQNGNTEAAKIYKQSVRALEENVSQKIAYIEEFEKNSVGVLKGLEIDKKLMDEDGMKMLEDYLKNGNLMMPEEKWTEIKATPNNVSGSEFSSFMKVPKTN